MKNVYGIIFLLMILFSVNLNAQDDIKSDKYWFVEDFDDDLLVAYHEDCSKYVYSHSGKKLLNINDAYTMFEKVYHSENLYKTVRCGIIQNRKFDPSRLWDSKLEQYWWYSNENLQPIKSKGIRSVKFAGKVYYLLDKETYIELRDEAMELIFKFEDQYEREDFYSYSDDIWFRMEGFSVYNKEQYFWIIDYGEIDENNNNKITVYDAKGKLVFEIWAQYLSMIRGGYWVVKLEDKKEYLLDENYRVDKSTAHLYYGSEALVEDQEEHPIFPYVPEGEMPPWVNSLPFDTDIEGTDSCFVWVSDYLDQASSHSLSGVFNLETRQEVLPCIYESIIVADSNLLVLEKDLGNEEDGEDLKYAIYQLNPKGARAITDFEFDVIDVLNPRFAVVRKGKKYFLYNIKKQKISKAYFKEIYCENKVHVYLKRFGEWSMFNAEKGKFEYNLGEIEQPHTQDGYWLLENYDLELWMDEESDERYKRKEMADRDFLRGYHGGRLLFRDTDFTPHVISPDLPVNIYVTHNRKISVSVEFNQRFHIYEEYILYKNEKGFHLMDTTGKHWLENKTWQEAGFINPVIYIHGENLFCLVKTQEGKNAIFDVFRDKIICDDLTTSKKYNDLGNHGLECRVYEKDMILYDSRRDQLAVFPNLYDNIVFIKRGVDGNYVFLVELGSDRFWVDSQGYYKNACLNAE